MLPIITAELTVLGKFSFLVGTFEKGTDITENRFGKGILR